MIFPRSTFVSGLLATALALAACAGSHSPTETATPDAAASDAEGAPAEELPPEPGAEAVAFDEMSMKEQRDYMKEVVVPAMAKTFSGFDADEFDDVDCTTCHGPAARSGDFEMPTKSLPALDAEEMDEHPEWTRFMKEEVTPQMAKLLGEPVYDPETHTGFGCYDCHTKK